MPAARRELRIHTSYPVHIWQRQPTNVHVFEKIGIEAVGQEERAVLSDALLATDEAGFFYSSIRQHVPESKPEEVLPPWEHRN